MGSSASRSIRPRPGDAPPSVSRRQRRNGARAKARPCRGVLLSNAMLELLRVDRPADAQPEAVRIGYDADERAASDRVTGIVRGRVVAKIA